MSWIRAVLIGTFNLAFFYFFFVWLFENIRPEIFFRYVSQMSLWSIAPALVLDMLALTFYGLRLAVLVDRPLGVSFQLANLGSGLNAVLPFRIGEIAKMYWAQRIFSVPIPKLLIASLVEKYCDLVALSLMTGVLVLYFDNRFIGSDTVTALLAVTLGGYLVIVIFSSLLRHFDKKVSGQSRIRKLIDALSEYRQSRRLSKIYSYTSLIWVINIATIYISFSRLLPGVPLGAADSVALLLIIAFAVAVPSTPAGLGVVEVGIIAYLGQVLNVENELALASALIFHVAIRLPQIALTTWIILRFLIYRPLASRHTT